MRNLEETFEYDSQNRLKKVRLGPTLTGASVYDSYGRMTAKTANGQQNCFLTLLIPFVTMGSGGQHL
jgi:hypothetical protein